MFFLKRNNNGRNRKTKKWKKERKNKKKKWTKKQMEKEREKNRINRHREPIRSFPKPVKTDWYWVPKTEGRDHLTWAAQCLILIRLVEILTHRVSNWDFLPSSAKAISRLHRVYLPSRWSFFFTPSKTGRARFDLFFSSAGSIARCSFLVGFFITDLFNHASVVIETFV